jgi:hypothetical protein
MIIFLGFHVATWVMAAIAAGAITAIVLIVLHWQRIVTFISEKCSALVNSNPENEAFSLHEKLENGNFQTVYGVLNKTTEKVILGEKIESNKVDPEVARFHAKEPLILFR